MRENSSVLIAFEERENLGVRYLAAVLTEAGHQVSIIDFRKDNREILEELLEMKPFLVGFSIIFEDHIYHFRNLIEYLRSEGVRGHFTAGGHFASLRPDELFGIAPSLDSIVRFEGEHTLLELVEHLSAGKEWRNITGISYSSNGQVVHNDIRPLEPDLDSYPFPVRSGFEEYVLERLHTTLMAGRGCIYNCIYCNIGEFYRLPRGPSKRIRNPVKVVEEMLFYYSNYGCSVFLFQDDDFPVVVKKKHTWIQDFCYALKENDLVGKILWKINCRPDEVTREPFELMKEHGLFRVYLGIEDGTDEGLQQMNKKQKSSDNINAVNILKDLGLSIDFGFMLFHPSTTFNSFRENLRFLETICGDGYMPVTFLKMLPYFGTKLEQRLREEGRLKGKPGFLDYDFPDKSLTDFHHFVFESFNTWLNSSLGVENLAQWANDYLVVYRFDHNHVERIQNVTQELRKTISDANLFMLETLMQLSYKFESGDYQLKKDEVLNEYKKRIKETHDHILEKINKAIQKVELFALTSQLFF